MKNFALVIWILFLIPLVTSVKAQNFSNNSIASIDDICGSDDRAPYNHAAVGRILTQPNSRPSTGWILFDGRIVTAAHVFDATVTSAVIEFNVPTSTCSSIQHPSASNVYQIDMNSIEKPQNYSLGNDWAICSVLSNSVTGLQPIEAQESFFYVEQTTSLNNLQLIGFGDDSECEKRYASQTSPGSYSGLDGTIVKHTCDTEGGSSGSPIINTATGKVVGIHTTSSCGSNGFNQGTSIYNSSLWNALGASSTLTVNQKRESGANLTSTTIKRWINISFQSYQVPATIPITYGTSEYLRGSDQLVSGPYEKFSKWNNYSDGIIQREFEVEYGTTELVSQFRTTNDGIIIKNNYPEVSGLDPSSDIVKFKDPWLLDAVDVGHSSSQINRGVNAVMKERPSPFNPNLTTSFSGDFYKGVFLNIDYNIPGQNHYSISTSPYNDIYLMQTSKTHRFHFVNWNATGADLQNNSVLETPVVFTTSNAVVTANFKGTHLSNNTTAFTQSNQRKFVRTSNGHQHLVYESMGSVWYERSTDNGATWTIMNNGSPVELGSKNPSIAAYADEVVIVYVSDGSLSIKLKYYENTGTVFSSTVSSLIGTYSPSPVVAVEDYGKIMVVWENSGIYYRFGGISWTYNTIEWSTSVTSISYANATAKDVSIACLNGNNLVDFALAWGENNGDNIEVYKATGVNNNTAVSFSGLGLYNNSTIGYTDIYLPSVTVNSSNTYCLAFIAERTGSKKIYTYFNSQFYSFGTTPYAPNISTDAGSSIITYLDGTSGKYARIYYYTEYKNLNLYGGNVQLTPGTSLNNLYAINLSTSVTPYSFNQVKLSTLPKLDSYQMKYVGREGVITKNNIGFYFSLGFHVHDESEVLFSQNEITTEKRNMNKLNKLLETEPLALNEEGLTIELKYGLNDFSKSTEFLKENKNVKLKLEIIDAGSSKIIEKCEDVKVKKDFLQEEQNRVFKIKNTGNIDGLIKIRLVADIDFEADEYTLTNVYYENENLTKVVAEEISINDQELPDDLTLLSNYPNPFNPSTVISYSLPVISNVRLTIYNIMGEEINSFEVNGLSPGMQSFKWDGTNKNQEHVTSGIYIYKLQATGLNGQLFNKSAKMIMLK